MAKIDADGKHIIKTQVKTALESLANEVEKKGALDSIQPQLEHIFKILLEIESNWETIDKQ